MSLADELRREGFGDVADDTPTRTEYSRDASIFVVEPEVVVRPEDVDEVKHLVRFASERAGEVWLTPRVGGTCMSGGAVGESIVIDLATHMSKVHAVSSDGATADAGTPWLALEEQMLEQGIIMPSYPASRALAGVGGMVSNNAGGEKSLRYGQTVDFIRTVRAVMADGNEYEFGPLTQDELHVKLAQQDFEGQLYRDVYWLIEDNRELIAKAEPRVSKNASGYLLWKVWRDGEFNLARLLTGAQGTLGIVTQATFDVVPLKPERALVVAYLRDVSKAADAVGALLKHEPESLESFDDKTVGFTMRFLSDFVRVMGAGNLLSLGFSFLPDAWMALRNGIPKLILLCEFTGDDTASVGETAGSASQALQRLKIPTRIVTDARAAERYWTVRRESFNVLRNRSTAKKTVPFVDDFIVRPEFLPEFLPQLEELLKPYPMTLTIAGHAGNGNFHVIPLMDMTRADVRDTIEEVGRKVYDLVLKYEGSITAEHNDGLVRGPYVRQQYGDEVYGLFRRVKAIFDPKGIFNPGKKIDVDWDWAMDHLRKD
jgi:FAD/FMN-containing dehydrogenase